MDLEITPEPRPEERGALLAGIERLLTRRATAAPPQYSSAWRRAGILEATGREAPPLPAWRGPPHR